MPRHATALNDDVIIVTGAASGIGRELTKEWVRIGGRVAMLDVNREGLDEVSSTLPAGRTLCITTDICDIGACQAAVETVTKTWGRIDVLANNAGISHHSDLRNADLGVLRRVMEVYFFGTVNLTHTALPELIKSQGRIVVLSSVAGFSPLIGRTGYAASKHALHGFFDTLRAELREQKVYFTLACPSFTKTAIDDNAMAGDGSSLCKDKKVVGKLLRAEDVAAAVIASSERRQSQVLISPLAKASYWLSRLVPPAFERVMRRTTASVSQESV
ncbi:MAG: SDR family oxidoreductase [Myxococcales bacterium]|nr:SDR family oxidoreductase [Myxococcales bacterium]